MKNCKIILLALLLVTGPAAWAQYSTGTNLLAQTNITGAFNAFNSAASASNPNAEVYTALTRLLALPSNSPAGTFLNELGISPSGRNVYHWRAKPETNSNGHTVIPAAFNPDEFTGELRNDVVPTLIASEGNLAQITDTSFTLLMPRSVTHFGGDVTIDYGDVQMLRAMMDAETVFMYKLNTLNLDVPYGSASNIIKTDQSIETLLTSYPSLLALANASDFTLARAAFTNAVGRYLAASQFIRNRPAGGPTRLFNLGTNTSELNSEQNFRTFLTDLQSSLGAPFGGPGSDANAIPGAKFFGAISGFTNRTFSLSNFLSGQNSIRPLLPTFASQKADFIWDSFPDPTLGGVITGLTETNLGKLFVQSLHAGAELNVPGVTATVVSTVTDHSGLGGSLNGVVQGTDGNFYGTVPYGGNFGSGAFFKATPSGGFSVLYSFGGVGNATGSQLDGGSPSGLVISGGNFYGTTQYGGSNGNGTIFKITPSGSLTTLYSFGDQDDGTITGGNPLIFAGGSFYGTTPYGGDNGGGVIFQVTLSTGFGGSHVAFNQLYSLPGSFSPFAPNGTGVGAGALVQGSDGNLYGATQYGGDGGGGSLFQFIPGSQNPYYEFSFPAMYDQFGDQIPLGINTVVQGSDGVFYGTTQYGGDLQDSSGGLGDGMIFSIDTNGNFNTLYTFDENNFDGFNPTGPLVAGGNGVFYGITSSGGANGVGTIFSFTPGGVPNFLVWFNENLGKQQGSQNGNAGFYYNTTIAAGLIAGTSGFYGTAPDGGTNGDGTIFKVTVFSAASILIPPVSTTGVAGSNVALTVSAGGAGPLTYQWRKVGATSLPGNASGATTPNLTFTSLTTADAGSYFVVVSNTHGGTTSAVAVLTVITPTTIAIQPATPVIVAQGQTLSLNVGAAGTGPFNYQWFGNNVSLSDVGTITGSLTSNLVINPAAAGDSGSYFVIVAGAVNSVTSRVSVVNVGTAPFVYSPPSSTNVIGATVTLPAQAGGALPLTFHWRKNGTVLANSGTHLTGATTANLTLAGLTSADAGSYSLVVTNAFGGATSAVTVLTVVPPPMITTQPVTPLNVAEGGNLGLHVGVNGTGTLTYQWFSNNVMVADGGNVSGSTAANLVINPASLGNSGSYFVVVSNAFGSATSIVSVVTVGIGPSVMTPPSTTNLISSGVTLPAVASGTLPLHYQWRKNTTGNASAPVSNSGSHVTGATNATLTLSGLIPADAGSYFIVVTNAFGAATSTVTVLTVVPPPIFTTQPATPVNIAQGQALNLTVGVSGTGPLTYQWIVNNTNLADGGNISGSASTALVINPAYTSNSGSYSVIVSNAFGSITSRVSLVTVGIGPSIITPPADTNDLVHSNVVLTVSAGGTTPLSYQWRRAGAPMGSHATGTTTSSLTLSALALTDTGSYFVVVTNTYGSVTSAVAVLIVNAPPAIPTPLAGPGTVLQGQTLSLHVGAVGTSPLIYQWLSNNIILADDTNTTGSATSNLVISRAYTNDSASYSVVVTNAFGSITGRVTVVVSPDRTAPTVTITSPSSDGARSNAPVTFLGNALDNVLVTNVSYSISNLNGAVPIYSNATLTVGPGSISNWSITVSPAAGSNILTVRSQDFSGNSSAPATRKFFLKSPVALPVAYAGDGNGTASGHASITGDAIPTNGALLNVGESYTITATPGANCYFVNWTGTAGTTNGPTLSFIMQSNTSLTATFITNIFIGMAGTYNGLFSSDALGVTEETAGMIGNLVLTSNGTFTATVYLGGSAPSISGSFSHDAGYASNQISTTLDKFVKVELYVNANTAPRTITGFVIGTNNIVSNNGVVAAGWTSAVNLFASTNNTRADSGAYTVLIPPPMGTGFPSGVFPSTSPGGNSGGTGAAGDVAHLDGTALTRSLSDQAPSGPATPTGTGYLLLTNNPGATPAAAIVKITGALADGTVISQTVPIGEDNGIPVYQSLYTTTSATTNGLLFGRLSLATTPAPSGALVWIKKASSSGLFGAGFTNYNLVLGSYWSNSIPIANVILPNSPLIFSDGGLTASLQVNVSLSGTNLLALGAPANFGPASINTNTGQLTITFTNGIRRTGFGAVLQDSFDFGPSFGGGFFLMGTTNAGSISLQAPSVGN